MICFSVFFMLAVVVKALVFGSGVFFVLVLVLFASVFAVLLAYGMCFSCWASSLLGFSCWLPWCLLSLGWAVSVLPVLLLVVVVLA